MHILNCISENDTVLRIFTIGFQACGTTGIHSFFVKNRINSFHWRFEGDKDGKRALSYCMKINYLSNSSTKVLSFNNNTLNYRLGTDNCYKLSCGGIKHFSDFGMSLIMNDSKRIGDEVMWEHIDSKLYWYYILDQQYPKKFKYILNIRPIYKWLQSRFSLYWLAYYKYNGYLYRKMRANQIMNITQLFTVWTNDWYRYICRCINYFQTRYHENKLYKQILLIYDIENDDITKLIKFLEMDSNLDAHLERSRKRWVKKNYGGRHSHTDKKLDFSENEQLEIETFLNNTFNVTIGMDLPSYNEIDEIERICKYHLYQDDGI